MRTSDYIIIGFVFIFITIIFGGSKFKDIKSLLFFNDIHLIGRAQSIIAGIVAWIFVFCWITCLLVIFGYEDILFLI